MPSHDKRLSFLNYVERRCFNGVNYELRNTEYNYELKIEN